MYFNNRGQITEIGDDGSQTPVRSTTSASHAKGPDQDQIERTANRFVTLVNNIVKRLEDGTGFAIPDTQLATYETALDIMLPELTVPVGRQTAGSTALQFRDMLYADLPPAVRGKMEMGNFNAAQARTKAAPPTPNG